MRLAIVFALPDSRVAAATTSTFSFTVSPGQLYYLNSIYNYYTIDIIQQNCSLHNKIGREIDRRNTRASTSERHETKKQLTIINYRKLIPNFSKRLPCNAFRIELYIHAVFRVPRLLLHNGLWLTCSTYAHFASVILRTRDIVHLWQARSWWWFW